MEELKKRIAADLKAMFVECEHGCVEPDELAEQINELMADCRDDLAAGSITEREMASLVKLIGREAAKLNITIKLEDA